jgi:type IV secretion system protein VirB8
MEDRGLELMKAADQKTTRAERKAITRADMDIYRKERGSVEIDLLDEVLTSRKRAWQVASGFAAFGLMAWIVAGGTMLRYAQPLPQYLLTLNKSTGELSQVSIVTQNMGMDEATDQYWVSQFVIHREAYDFYAGQTDFDFMRLTAAGQVADDYMQQYRGSKPKDKVLGDSESTSVHINSVIVDTKHRVATVRYTTTKRVRDRPLAEPPQYWIATVAYDYVHRPMTAAERFINPAGFQVTSFRPNLENPANVGRVGG